MFHRIVTAVCIAAMALLLVGPRDICQGAERASELEQGFVHPPDSARPWVYWFWLNGNITREGITADLEAMKRVGIGGVLIMEVDQGAPVGPVAFMSPQWRELFKHVVAEAQRLGLEVNMNDDAGWNGSGGPWIKPEAVHAEGRLERDDRRRAEAIRGHAPAAARPSPAIYRDIAVLAFPTPGEFRIDNIQGQGAPTSAGGVVPAAETKLPPEMVIDRDRIVDLTAQMDKDGRLAWDVPAGKWTVLRIGHTSTGVDERAVAGERARPGVRQAEQGGDRGAVRRHDGAKLIADVGPAAGKTLVATHIDSWENGSQNWTARMREEFQKRRGYDLLPFLPVLTGRVVDSLEVSERFLWDLRQTVSDLVVENYAGHMEKLAQQHGLRLSIEAYGGPCDDMTYAGRADEPMCEFWIGGGALRDLQGDGLGRAHLRQADPRARNRSRPTTRSAGCSTRPRIKALGDRAFCEGVNRFVFHRYAMQPWLNYKPGMTMGPWGLHYERTETWWEQSRPWHEYLARCQLPAAAGAVRRRHLLSAARRPRRRASPGHRRSGYDYDDCTAEVVLTRMSVKDGRIVLPDGMSYRLLVLPRRDHDDAAAAAQDQGTGRGRRDGRRPAAAEVAEPDRLPEVRRGGEATGRRALGRLRRQDCQRARLRQRQDRLGTDARRGPGEDGRAARLHGGSARPLDSSQRGTARTSTSSPSAGQQPTETLCRSAWRASSPSSGSRRRAGSSASPRTSRPTASHAFRSGSSRAARCSWSSAGAPDSFDPVVSVTRDGQPILPAPSGR